MGLDLSTILAAMGTVFVGDAISVAPGFSIGGSSPAVEDILGNLGGLLGMTWDIDDLLCLLDLI
jgi:hypothetical protein